MLGSEDLDFTRYGRGLCGEAICLNGYEALTEYRGSSGIGVVVYALWQSPAYIVIRTFSNDWFRCSSSFLQCDSLFLDHIRHSCERPRPFGWTTT